MCIYVWRKNIYVHLEFILRKLFTFNKKIGSMYDKTTSYEDNNLYENNFNNIYNLCSGHEEINESLVVEDNCFLSYVYLKIL